MKTKELKFRMRRLAVLVVMLLLFAAGCSSTPKPVGEVASAKTAVDMAVNKDAAEYAPVAMDRAREKLRRAEQAMREEEFDEARRLAEEAQADAEHAEAVADKEQVQMAVRELESSIELLREELKRARER